MGDGGEWPEWTWGRITKWHKKTFEDDEYIYYFTCVIPQLYICPNSSNYALTM